jgi:hypothetical protein
MAAQTRSATEEAELILDKTSVRPGEAADGFILVDAPRDPGPVTLRVRVAGDLHEIGFAYTEL